MSNQAYFSPRAIKANEDAVRKSFAARPGDDADNLSKSRIGQRLGPAFIRAMLDEINRGTPPNVYQPALMSLIGWMLANSVASEPDIEKRLSVLAISLRYVQAEALLFAGGNDIVDPGKEAYGEVIGGHA